MQVGWWGFRNLHTNVDVSGGVHMVNNVGGANAPDKDFNHSTIRNGFTIIFYNFMPELCEHKDIN